MIRRAFQKGDAASEAVYSDCEAYRYSLTRIWEGAGQRVGFVMLNPSTATETQNDPTVERCERRARALGFGSFTVVNIFAWRDTDPRAMRAAAACCRDLALRRARLGSEESPHGGSRCKLGTVCCLLRRL